MSKKRHYTGLTTEQVALSRRDHGTNVLTPPEHEPLWKQFLEKFDDPLIKILLVALVLSVGLSLYEYFGLHMGASILFEPLGITIAIVLATLVGFLVEVNANKKFRLLNLTDDHVGVKVVRDGHITQIPRCDIVVGDIVILETGEKVPADGTVIESFNLRVDESSFTGEPSARKTHDTEVASQATETTSASEQVSQMGEVIGSNASNAASMDQAVNTMTDISDNLNATLKELEDISVRTDESIREVAEQTNETNTSANKIQEATAATLQV